MSQNSFRYDKFNNGSSFVLLTLGAVLSEPIHIESTYDSVGISAREVLQQKFSVNRRLAMAVVVITINVLMGMFQFMHN